MIEQVPRKKLKYFPNTRDEILTHVGGRITSGWSRALKAILKKVIKGCVCGALVAEVAKECLHRHGVTDKDLLVFLELPGMKMSKKIMAAILEVLFFYLMANVGILWFLVDGGGGSPIGLRDALGIIVELHIVKPLSTLIFISIVFIVGVLFSLAIRRIIGRDSDNGVGS